MKLIFSLLIIGVFGAGCGDVDRTHQDTKSGQKWNVDGKADHYGDVDQFCAEEGSIGCDSVGAECCGDAGLVCQEYTVYDYPRCLPPAKTQTWTTVQPRTRGDVMDCISSFTQDGKFLDVTISTEESDGDFVSLKIVERLNFDAQDRLIEDGLANATWGTSVYTWDFLAQSYYYDVALFRVPGYSGVYRGQVNSKIADEFWDVTCWEPMIEVTARYDELSGGCVDTSGQVGDNPELGPEFIRGSGFGECMKLTTALDEGFYGYQTFDSPQLAGSDLTDATMHFAHIENADLRGTDLDGFEFGYASVSGSINEGTSFSAERCESADDRLECLF